MTFAFVVKHRHVWPVSWMCNVLGVSRSGFRAWLRRPISARARCDAKLLVEIDKSFKASDRTFGARRVWAMCSRPGWPAGCTGSSALCGRTPLGRSQSGSGNPKDDGERSVVADNILDRDL